jgi:hypothetical protein
MFLQCPLQSSTELDMGEEGNAYVLGVLDCNWDTELTSTLLTEHDPPRLMLEKPRVQKSLPDLKRWERNAKAAKAQLDAFDQEALKELLGEEYDHH